MEKRKTRLEDYQDKWALSIGRFRKGSGIGV
jgi:hypothetical protein